MPDHDRTKASQTDESEPNQRQAAARFELGADTGTFNGKRARFRFVGASPISRRQFR
jgi:hypothetical protein